MLMPTSCAAGINEWAAAVSGVDWRVGLNIDRRNVGIGLPRDGADHTHGNAIFKAFRIAEGEHQFALF